MQYGLDKSSAAAFRHNLFSSIVVAAAAGLSACLIAGCAVKITPLSTVMPTTTTTTAPVPVTPPAAPAPVTPAPVVPTPVPVTPSPAGFASVTNFGDSITCGFYALPNDGAGYMYSNNGYATLLTAKVGATAVARNLCRGGDMAADMAKLWVYPDAEPELLANQLYTLLIGTNDAHFCGGYAGCLANWSQSLAASLAWLALPSADKVLGSAMTASQGGGSAGWLPDMDFGEATTHNGATLSFEVKQAVAGRQLQVAYRVFDSSARTGGTAVVSVDGVPVAALSATVATGHAIATQNGGTDTVFLASIPLGAIGEHSVTITTTSAEGGFFSVLWAGASTQSYADVSGAPTVVIGQLTPTGNDDLNVVVAQYNVALAPLVAGLVAEGMKIVVAPTATAFNPATEMSDTLHPNNVGHAKLAAVFASVLPAVD